jgi:hypothetical protein
VTSTPEEGRTLWRIGYYADPLGFTSREMYQFSHRFDDIRRRFRTLYCAELPETCLREVLADFRPNLGAMRRHVERYGPEAAEDFTPAPVTARWRAQHVLVPVVVRLDGPLVDLTDVPTRQAIEERHVELLVEHDVEHLDLHEITTSRRAITQTIAADYSTEAPVPCAFRLAWMATRALPFSKSAAPSARPGRPSRSRIRRPNRSPRSLTPWGLVLEPPPAAGHDH